MEMVRLLQLECLSFFRKETHALRLNGVRDKPRRCLGMDALQMQRKWCLQKPVAASEFSIFEDPTRGNMADVHSSGGKCTEGQGLVQGQMMESHSTRRPHACQASSSAEYHLPQPSEQLGVQAGTLTSGFSLQVMGVIKGLVPPKKKQQQQHIFLQF